MKKMKAAALMVGLSGVFMLAGGNAVAASPVTAQMKVTLNVVGSCLLEANDMDFGTHDSNEGKKIYASSIASVTCTKDLPYKLAAISNNSYKMKGATNGGEVPYTLYSDSAYSKVLSDTELMDGTGTGKKESVPLYGRVMAADLAQASVDSYSDDVTIQVTY
ncbi:lipoprotein [Salmonella enterica subsp. enterica serovar Choleraesuis]|nr:lipoprotein [Salmonella enterica subsp. enterica serovar Choleraesuis]